MPESNESAGDAGAVRSPREWQPIATFFDRVSNLDVNVVCDNVLVAFEGGLVGEARRKPSTFRTQYENARPEDAITPPNFARAFFEANP